MPRGVAAKGGQRKGQGPKAHKLAEEFPDGMVLQDLVKKQWHLGKVIGQGGFGLLYLGMILPMYVLLKLVELSTDDVSLFNVCLVLAFIASATVSFFYFKHTCPFLHKLFAASDNISVAVNNSTASHVVKIEPLGNGPLYCEMQFYQRVAKLSTIQDFTKKYKLHYLGIPPYVAAGRIEYKSQEYRFLVMPRFGTDLQKLLKAGGGTFLPQTTFAIGLRMVDALQFLHENEYVHADIKASNILLGYARGAEIKNEVYLVDYGLVKRYTVDGVHQEYREDPRKAHNGTIEFTSIDAHKGLSPSRRGDFEILGYCLLQWLSGQLPWEDDLTDPSYVFASKQRLLNNVQSFVSTCLSHRNAQEKKCMSEYFELVKKLRYDDTPDYKRFKDILKSGMVHAGQKDEWKLDFPVKAKAQKRKSTEPDIQSPPSKKAKSPAKSAKSAAASSAKTTPKKLAAASKASKAKTATSRKTPPASAKPKFAGIKHSSAMGRSPKSPAAAKGRSPKSPAAAKGRSPKSPAAAKGRSPKSPAVVRTPMTNGKYGSGTSKRPKTVVEVPPPGKVTPLTPAGSLPKSKKAATKRTVKRVTAVKSDAAIQTSPGLRHNR